MEKRYTGAYITLHNGWRGGKKCVNGGTELENSGTKVLSMAFWTATCAKLEESWEVREAARRFVIIPDDARKALRPAEGVAGLLRVRLVEGYRSPSKPWK